ncbi:MAG: 4Fe-4S dicluster domain-containing protein [Planctomycetota bacterium]
MKFRGGYHVPLAGRPASEVEVLPEPNVLHIPLSSRRFRFEELCVEEGQRVEPGQPLAKDMDNFALPLPAPRAGTVRLEAAEGHLTLEDVEHAPEEPYHPDQDREHIPQGLGSAGIKRYKLLMLGAWQFFRDAHTDELPDPFSTPAAVVVSAAHFEPYMARGDVQIHKRLSNFTRGLEHLQSLLEYQPIYLMLPQVESDFAGRVRETLRGYAYVQQVPVPVECGFDRPGLVANKLGLGGDDEPVWALDTRGVLAVDRALTLSRPSTVRIVTIGGPGAEQPRHLLAMPGYPLEELLEGRLTDERCPVLNGGVLTGERLSENQMGLDAECAGLTALAPGPERKVLRFMRPLLERPTFANPLSRLLDGRPRQMSPGRLGERRACISCGFCTEVCPAGVMPHLIHKYLYGDQIEEAERVRLDLCVRCGLCSYVCPSKIELYGQFAEAQRTVREELAEEEALT